MGIFFLSVEYVGHLSAVVQRVSENRVFMNTYGEMGFQNGAHIIHWKRWAKNEEKPS